MHKPRQVPESTPVCYERHRPRQFMLSRLTQPCAETFVTELEDPANAEMPQFVSIGFDVFLERGMASPRLPEAALPSPQSRQAGRFQPRSTRLLRSTRAGLAVFCTAINVKLKRLARAHWPRSRPFGCET